MIRPIRIGKKSHFLRDIDGDATPPTALLFAGIALAVAVLAAPALQGAVERYAEYRALGIDRVLTGSVGVEKRMTVRNSVLVDEPQVLCGPGSAQSCARD